MPEITEVQKFKYEPGDRFVLRFKGGFVTAEQAAEIAGKFRAGMQLPADAPVVVLDDSWDLTITNDTVKVTPGAPTGHEVEER